MLHLKYVEFYITNICNLNCTDCNRFNNFAFSGHYSWDNLKSIYKEWSRRLTFDHMSIIGGEPTLHPEFIDWVYGVLELWPTSKFGIVTNGTQLQRHPKLYQILLSNKDRMFLDLSLHGPTTKERVFENIKLFLKGPITKRYLPESTSNTFWQSTWSTIKSESWPECATIEEFNNLPADIKKECIEKFNIEQILLYSLEDENGVRIVVNTSDNFVNSSIKFDEQNKKFSLYNSDPVKANNVCYSKYCHHFIDGKLYKCNVVGILPNFIRQFNIDVGYNNHAVLSSYTPAEVTWDDDSLRQFTNSLSSGEVIDQCKFCPEVLTRRPIDASTKKIKIAKKLN